MITLNEMLWYSSKSLWHNKVRSALTVLGIVIGVASLVSLIALSEGLSYTINDLISQFGSQNVAVMPGSFSQQLGSGGQPGSSPISGRLFDKDMAVLEGVVGVEKVVPYVVTRQNVQYKDEVRAISVYGSNVEDYAWMFGDYLELAQGRFIQNGERGSVVLGGMIADGTVFGKQIPVGSFIYMGNDNKTKFRVAGVLKTKGSFTESDVDNTVLVSMEDAREIAGDGLAAKEVNGMMFRVADGFNVSEVADVAEERLASSRKQKLEDKDFELITSDTMSEQFSTITDLLSLFLGFISSISLVVGGVGVMNTMYVSVMERTREIGTLKAIGADSNSVLFMFVFESGLLGLFGGIIGLLIATTLSAIANFFGFNAIIRPEFALFALSFSFALGVVSGYLPSMKAASMQPIDALRYE